MRLQDPSGTAYAHLFAADASLGHQPNDCLRDPNGYYNFPDDTGNATESLTQNMPTILNDMKQLDGTGHLDQGQLGLASGLNALSGALAGGGSSSGPVTSSDIYQMESQVKVTWANDYQGQERDDLFNGLGTGVNAYGNPS
ncbi:MAG TPA: hypothetical protein VGO93_27895 [Candidatus Xenobia bacterium]|jgi:hypothetical protein